MHSQQIMAEGNCKGYYTDSLKNQFVAVFVVELTTVEINIYGKILIRWVANVLELLNLPQS